MIVFYYQGIRNRVPRFVCYITDRAFKFELATLNIVPCEVLEIGDETQRRRNMKMCTTLGALMLLLASFSTSEAIKVYESTLSRNAVNVYLSSEEVANAKASKKYCGRAGREVGEQMLGLAGIPESITGKVAAMIVCESLCLKYRHDVRKAVRNIPKGNSVTLKYYVNLEGVRDLWRFSDEVGDDLMPLGSCTKTVLKVANELVSSRMR